MRIAKSAGGFEQPVRAHVKPDRPWGAPGVDNLRRRWGSQLWTPSRPGRPFRFEIALTNRSPSTTRTGVPRLQVTAEATGPAGRSPKETHAKPNRLRKNGFWQSEVSCPRGGDVLSGPESRFAAPGYGPEGDQQGAGRARETPLGAVLPRPITPLERSESSSATPGSPSAPGCRP